MVMSRSKAKSDVGKAIKEYWDANLQEGGGILHDLLQDRLVEDVDILWCLRQAIEERDADAIMICGYMMGIMGEYDRRCHLRDILGYSTS